MSFNPVSPKRKKPERQAGVGDGIHIGRRRTEGIGDENSPEKENERPEGVCPRSVFGAGNGQIKGYSDDIKQGFQDKTEPEEIPDSQSNYSRNSRRQREVGTVCKKVEKPVTDDAEAEEQSIEEMTSKQEINKAKSESPDNNHKETVGNGVRFEIQRRKGGDTGNDFDFFQSQYQHYRPEEVDELDRK